MGITHMGDELVNILQKLHFHSQVQKPDEL